MICNLFLTRKNEEFKLAFDIIVTVEEAKQSPSLFDSSYKIKVGRITGSSLHQIFHTRVETPHSGKL